MRQPALRAHAEAAGRRPAFPDRTQRATATEVTRDDRGLRLAEQPRRALGDVTMARPVEAPALDAVFLRPFKRHCIEAFARRDRLVKAGFECGHEGNLRQFSRQEPYC